MSRQENIIEKFEKCVSDILLKKLNEDKELISVIDEYVPEEEVREILKRANSLISFAAGENKDLYEEYRYRFIVDDMGNYHIIMGREVRVEPPKRRRRSAEE
jgi:hypothetical protein